MKAHRILLLVVLFAACKALAQQQTQMHATVSPASGISTTVKKPQFHWLMPTNPAVSVENRNHVEGLDPRPWTKIVGWHPGESEFPNPENFSTGMPLIWIGQPPTDQN